MSSSSPFHLSQYLHCNASTLQNYCTGISGFVTLFNFCIWYKDKKNDAIIKRCRGDREWKIGLIWIEWMHIIMNQENENTSWEMTFIFFPGHIYFYKQFALFHLTFYSQDCSSSLSSLSDEHTQRGNLNCSSNTHLQFANPLFFYLKVQCTYVCTTTNESNLSLKFQL